MFFAAKMESFRAELVWNSSSFLVLLGETMVEMQFWFHILGAVRLYGALDMVPYRIFQPLFFAKSVPGSTIPRFISKIQSTTWQQEAKLLRSSARRPEPSNRTSMKCLSKEYKPNISDASPRTYASSSPRRESLKIRQSAPPLVLQETGKRKSARSSASNCTLPKPWGSE